MIRALCLVAAFHGVAASADESHYVDVSLPVDGTLLAAEFLDVDADGRPELVVAVRLANGTREIRIHDFGAASLSATPRRTIRVLEDVIAWTFADVRSDPGRELVLLTRSGAFSLDPNVERLRGNIRRLFERPLLFDAPDPRALPYWSYVIQARGGEVLLLPERDGFAIFGPPSGGVRAADGTEPEWVRQAYWPAASGSVATDPDDDAGRKQELENDRRSGEARFAVTVGSDFLPFLDSSESDSLASDSRSMRAPALIDVDGDGRRDLLLLRGKELWVHVATADGIPGEPTRKEALPAYLEHDKEVASLRLVDLDDDGVVDVLAVWSEKQDGFDNVEWRVFVMLSRKGRLFPPEPDQVLRFEAASVRIDIGRIDADKRTDLMIRTFLFPGQLQALTGLEFEFAHLLYRGEKGGFERRPTMRDARTFDENGVREVVANRRMSMDCSGDGLADLVEVGLDGKIAIKRLRKESGFLSATKWLIDDSPWKSYTTRGSVLSLEVRDLNGDGLGDLMSRGEAGLTLLLSKKGRG